LMAVRARSKNFESACSKVSGRAYLLWKSNFSSSAESLLVFHPAVKNRRDLDWSGWILSVYPTFSD